ncbi:translocation/assembly module TamB domain-containing protein [Thiomicrospira microaerophila]|uniref:translocation/assembly module TamB domain-containing protein n=1 Tax=Thiomicrospira microaerophila TaxID=406020 RepID=UPI00389B1C30
MQAQHHWSLSPEQLTLSSDWTKIKGQLLDLGHLNIQPSQTHIRYQFADAQLQLQTTLAGQLADWPAGKLQLGLNVIGLHRADQQLTGEMTLLTPQYGELSTQFEIDWINPVFDWRQPHTLHLALQTAQLNLSALHQDWDYQIDSQLHFHLSDLQKRQSHLDIHQLTLHGLTHPLSTQGQISTRLDDHHDYHLEGQLEAIHYDQLALTVRLDAQLAKTLDGITLHQLSFSQADNQLSLNGVLNQQSYQFELDAALNQLSELLSPWGVAGQAHLNLQTQGSVNTDWTHIDQAWLQVQATSDQLQWDDILFHTLQLDADIPLHQPAWGQLNAQLAKITQGEEVVSAALHLKRTVQADGMRNEISLHHPSAQIEMASLERQPNLTHWVFDLERLRITQPQTGIWLLNQPSTLRWNASDQLKLSQSCLGLVSHPNSQICLDAQDHQLNWVLHQLPILEWAAEFIPDHVDIDTQLNAQGFINWQQDLKIQQQILFKQLDLRVTEQGYEWPVKLRNWQTTFNWQPTEARIESQASINDTGHLGANIQLFPVEGGWRQAEIDGYVRLQLNEWMLSEQLTRQFELTRTQLDWQTLVMGSLNDIQHNSRALVDIDFNLALLELKNQNLSLQADIANESLHAFGLWRQQGLSTNPREARIHLQAAPLNTQAKLKLDISTESMEIVRTPFAHLFLGADMQLQLDQAGAVLRGEARIHDSYLDLDKMPLHQRTSVNTDEIIITREGEEVRHEKGLGFPLDYSLTLTLGDNVRLNVREAQAYLGGALTLAQTPEMEDIQALGEVRIESGYVELDRRNRINFDPSSFSFTGNLDNPRLNVNLFRHVDRTTARLNITGTSTQPQFVFYANPAQSQARIINLLIFGRAGDLENEPNYQSQILTAFYKLGIQNNTPVLNRLTRTLGVEDIYFDVQDQQVSSLLLGRALTNDIYIRYAHDLSGGQNNAVQIFYQLTPRWLLKSDNRGDRSSVDLIFQQERD